jgi:hypothetical protein
MRFKMRTTGAALSRTAARIPGMRRFGRTDV